MPHNTGGTGGRRMGKIPIPTATEVAFTISDGRQTIASVIIDRYQMEQNPAEAIREALEECDRRMTENARTSPAPEAAPRGNPFGRPVPESVRLDALRAAGQRPWAFGVDPGDPISGFWIGPES